MYWLDKFADDGSCNEIYTGRAPDCIIGLTFVQAALVSSIDIFLNKKFSHVYI